MNRYVYFIRPVDKNGPIKIGCSHVPEDRLVALATWSPVKLEIIGRVPGNLKDEKFIHDCFCDQHSHHEWFAHSVELQTAIDSVLEAETVDVLRGRLTRKGSIQKHRGAKWSADQRKRASYNSRISNMERRLRKRNPDGAWVAPDDVQDILHRWRGWICRGIESVSPTPEEFQRMDEYLADPEAHSVVPERLRKVAA